MSIASPQRAPWLHLCDEDCPIPGPLHRGRPVLLPGYPPAPHDCDWRPDPAKFGRWTASIPEVR